MDGLGIDTAPRTTGGNPPWSPAFTITRKAPGTGQEVVVDGLPLIQIGDGRFELDPEVTIRYNGITGLEGQVAPEVVEDIRIVDVSRLPNGTDLASVPRAMLWFANRYGPYTPAALIHDRLIEQGADEDTRIVTDEQADRNFRYMLGSVGVPVFKRWIMWSAVALATRVRRGGLTAALAYLWVVLALTGNLAFFGALIWLIAAPSKAVVIVLAVSAAGPIVATPLCWWGRWAAGLSAGFAGPWILPPAILSTASTVVYKAVEFVARPFDSARS